MYVHHHPFGRLVATPPFFAFSPFCHFYNNINFTGKSVSGPLTGHWKWREKSRRRANGTACFRSDRLQRKMWSSSEGCPSVPENFLWNPAFHLHFIRLNRKFWLNGKRPWSLMRVVARRSSFENCISLLLCCQRSSSGTLEHNPLYDVFHVFYIVLTTSHLWLTKSPLSTFNFGNKHNLQSGWVTYLSCPQYIFFIIILVYLLNLLLVHTLVQMSFWTLHEDFCSETE